VSDSQSIIGFTEAELGLFLAVLFLILALGSQSVAPSKIPSHPKTSAPIDLSQKVEQQNKDIKALSQQLSAATKRADIAEAAAKHANSQQQHLRSKQRPTCHEKGIQTGTFLFDVTVLAAGFQVGNKNYNWEELLQAYAPQLQQAMATDCSYTVRVYFDRALSSGALATSLQQLNQKFITTTPRLAD
jgi:hypothetical protein